MKLKPRLPSLPQRRRTPKTPRRPSFRLPLPHIRLLERRVLTATVDGSLIRVVGFGAGKPVVWQTIDLDGPGPYELGPEFKDFGPLRSRHLADLPFYATMLRYIPRPSVSRRYMAEVVGREVGGTLPFERDEIELTWTPFRDGRGPEIAATAIPTWEVDSHMSLLNKVGMWPAATYTRAVAMTAAAGIDSAVMVQLGPTAAGLVLVRGGIPRAVHQVELPHLRVDARQAADSIDRGIDELQAFDDVPVGDELPIIATGSLDRQPGLAKELASRFGDRYRTPVWDVQAPPDFPATDYAANIGLLLTDRAQRRRLAFRRPPIEIIGPDLLPMRHRRRRVPIQGIAALAAVFALAGAAYNLTPMVQTKVATADALEARVSTLERGARVERIRAGRETTLLRQIAADNALIEAVDRLGLNGEIDAALFNERISMLTTDVPVASVLLGAVSLNNGAFQVSGAGGSFADVLAFAEELRVSPLFDTAELGPLTNQGFEADLSDDDDPDAVSRPVTFSLSGEYGGEPDAEAGETAEGAE